LDAGASRGDAGASRGNSELEDLARELAREGWRNPLQRRAERHLDLGAFGIVTLPLRRFQKQSRIRLVVQMRGIVDRVAGCLQPAKPSKSRENLIAVP